MKSLGLTYWHSGGAIITAKGRAIAPDDAWRLSVRHQHAAEVASAHNGAPRDEALRLANELRTALEAAARWRRAAAAYEPGGLANRAANSSRELTLGNGPSGAGRPRKSHSGPQPSATS